jgi:hypothetical protein
MGAECESHPAGLLVPTLEVDTAHGYGWRAQGDAR